MVSYPPPLYNLSIYNRNFFDYEDSSLSATDARYLKKTINDTTTSSQLNLSSDTLNVGSATLTSANTINGVAITLASAASTGNILINRPLSIGYNPPSSAALLLMGYTASIAASNQPLVSGVFKNIRNQSLTQGNWVVSTQITITCTAAGTLSNCTYGVSSNNAAVVPFAVSSVESFLNPVAYVLNETEKFCICFPYQQTTTSNMNFFGQATFTGTFNISAASLIMRVA